MNEKSERGFAIRAGGQLDIRRFMHAFLRASPDHRRADDVRDYLTSYRRLTARWRAQREEPWDTADDECRAEVMLLEAFRDGCDVEFTDDWVSAEWLIELLTDIGAPVDLIEPLARPFDLMDYSVGRMYAGAAPPFDPNEVSISHIVKHQRRIMLDDWSSWTMFGRSDEFVICDRALGGDPEAWAQCEEFIRFWRKHPESGWVRECQIFGKAPSAEVVP